MAVTPRDARQPLFQHPKRRLLAELYCFYLIFRFHEHNNDLRKAFTITVVGVWATIEVGSAFGAATPPEQFLYFRIIVSVLLGRMWDIQVNNFAGIEFQHNADAGDDDD